VKETVWCCVLAVLAGCGSPESPERAERPSLASVAIGPDVTITDLTRVEADCRMTGGGWVVTSDGLRVSQGYALHALGDLASRLDVTWGPGHRFRLEALETATCLDHPDVDGVADAAYDTFVGTGRGQLDGGVGSIFFTFVDGGEDGAGDLADLVVYDAHGDVVLDVSDHLAAEGDPKALLRAVVER